MLQRTSIVEQLHLDSVSFSSVIELGDSSYIQGFSRALAIQREEDIFFGNEGDFNRFPVFSIPFSFLPVEENFTMFTTQLHPIIKVKTIEVMGTSSAAVIHIGSSNHILMESRVKHIRQLRPKE